MIINASGMSIGIGLALALDTLCSQANGARKYKVVMFKWLPIIIYFVEILICCPSVGRSARATSNGHSDFGLYPNVRPFAQY
jgi:hypothetical protein